MREAKTFELVEVRRRLGRRITRNRLRSHGAVLDVLELVHDGVQSARVNLHRATLGLEVPRAARVHIEFNRDEAAGIDLGIGWQVVLGAGNGLLGQRQDVDARDFANGPVNRHQGVTEGEHAERDDAELAHHLEVFATKCHGVVAQ